MAEIQDVAYYIMRKLSDNGETTVSSQKLQLLMYYCYAWSLVWEPQQPLYDATFEAWANGPVNPELYERLKGKLTVTMDDFNTNDTSDTYDTILSSQ